VCIPTRDRPDLLIEAVRSCLGQTLRPFEILIGDDSCDDRTEQAIRTLDASGVPVRYHRNCPPLGQARNVDLLFSKASGDRVILLHDDDRLAAGAIEKMAACFAAHPEIVAVFGKQIVTDERGREDWKATEALNRCYFRTPDRGGLLGDPLKAAILQQFPNDGFMVDARRCKELGYDDKGRAGGACDFYFGLRLGLLRKPFFFLDDYTAYYCLTARSIGRSREGDTALRAVRILLEDIGDATLFADRELRRAMEMRMRPAIMQAAILGQRRMGLKWFFSHYHRKYIVSLGGIRRLLMLSLPRRRG
jgi:glycosyltransferase involved in cell wall biosynthesis